jgi:hypothetical protein
MLPKSKVHQWSQNLLWSVISVLKLAKWSSRSSNLLIESYESQIYLSNLLKLLRPWDRAMLPHGLMREQLSRDLVGSRTWVYAGRGRAA